MKFKIAAIFLMLALSAALSVLWQNVYREKFLKVAYPEKYAGYVLKYAKQNGLDEDLVFAVIKNESGFRPGARSRIGALGLMQLTPDTFEWAQMLKPGGADYAAEELYNPDVNIRYGSVVLRALLDEFREPQVALAAYHAGRGNVKKWLADSRYSSDGRTLSHIPFEDTRSYVSRVLAAQKVYKTLYHSR